MVDGEERLSLFVVETKDVFMGIFDWFRKESDEPMTAVFLNRPEQRTAAPVSESWKRLENWFAANLPVVAEALQPGCSPAELAAFENEFGVTLPEDVKQSFLIHNGQKQYTHPGAIAGQPFDSLERVQHSFEFHRRCYVEDQQGDIDPNSGIDNTSFPPDAIHCENLTPNWISLGYWDGNCYGLDLDPGPNGVIGQVINFGNSEDDKFVLALSWAHFLEDIADEFEAGNLFPILNEDGRLNGIGRPGHRDQALFNFYRQWSEAKLSTEFQNVAPAPKSPIIEDTVVWGEIADQVARVVTEFIEAMHLYEMKWLKIRPIHELGYRYISESGSGLLADPFMDGRKVAAEKELKFHKYRRDGIAEKKVIFQRFTTPRTRTFGESFVQRYPIAYDPSRDRVAEVRAITSEKMLVVMHPVDGLTTRYHLLQEDGKWLIDIRDSSWDCVKFEKYSL